MNPANRFFNIMVVCGVDSWRLSYCYGDFERFREECQQEPQITHPLPTLPRKTVMASASKEFLTKRMDGLKTFLYTLLSKKSHLKNKKIREFLDLFVLPEQSKTKLLL